MGPDRIEKIKATASFPPAAGNSRQDLTLKCPPFEESVLEDIVRRQSGIQGKIEGYPAVVQIQLAPASDYGRAGRTSSPQSIARASSINTESLTRLIDGLTRLKAKWVDFSDGEPVLHPEFGPLARSCVDNGLKVKLLTNAAWHDDEMVEFLVEVFSFVSVNLDAGSQQVYDRIHHSKPGDFQGVLKNVEDLVRHREECRSQLVLGAEANLTQWNMNFTEEIAALARDLGLDYVRFRAGRTGPDFLLPEQRETAEALIRELINGFHPFPIHCQIAPSEPVDGCRISHFQLVVDACGDFYVCPEFRQRHDLRPFGNILDQSADELWLGPEHQKTLTEVDRSPCPVVDCPWCGYNRFLPEVHA
jgi:MoaA/NifB/PqqE/SkfB family radical SAM enzyme